MPLGPIPTSAHVWQSLGSRVRGTNPVEVSTRIPSHVCCTCMAMGISRARTGLRPHTAIMRLIYSTLLAPALGALSCACALHAGWQTPHTGLLSATHVAGTRSWGPLVVISTPREDSSSGVLTTHQGGPPHVSVLRYGGSCVGPHHRALATISVTIAT